VGFTTGREFHPALKIFQTVIYHRIFFRSIKKELHDETRRKIKKSCQVFSQEIWLTHCSASRFLHRQHMPLK